jgi:hypothetical protein
MPEPVTLATLAKLFAAEAGKEFGKKIAEELVRLVTTHLASAKDVERAVEEIKRYIDQSFDELRDGNLRTHLDTANDRLASYGRTGQYRALQDAELAISYARSWYTEASRLDEKTFRRRALPLGFKLAATEIAIKAADAAHGGNKRELLKDLQAVCALYADELQAAIADVRNYWAEAVSAVDTVPSDYVSGRPPPIDGAPDIITLYAGRYFVSGPRYPNGRVMRLGEKKGSETEAINDMTIHKRAEESRILDEYQAREREVLVPVSEFVSKIRMWSVTKAG